MSVWITRQWQPASTPAETHAAHENYAASAFPWFHADHIIANLKSRVVLGLVFNLSPGYRKVQHRKKQHTAHRLTTWYTNVHGGMVGVGGAWDHVPAHGKMQVGPVHP